MSTNLGEFLGKYFFHHRISNLQRNRFMAHARQLVQRRTKVVLTGVVLLLALFWPLDFLIIPDS